MFISRFTSVCTANKYLPFFSNWLVVQGFSPTAGVMRGSDA
jgi:hypothetical protein